MMHLLLAVVSAAAVLGAGPPRLEGYLVLVEPGEDRGFLGAAERVAGMHGGEVVEVSFGDLGGVERVLREERPRWVVLVMPPGRIDVELSRRVMEMAARVDDDPFLDFEYGFVTGRDGAAAEGFAGRIEAGWWREWGRRTALFGTWEGPALPRAGRDGLTAMGAMGLEGTAAFVLMKDEEGEREKAARGALEGLKGRDTILLFSHGYPGEMVGCFTGGQLRAWGIDLGPAVVFSSACYNGAPGRWWTPGMLEGRMGMVEQGPVAAGESAALAILESGVTGAFLGVDPWHGPLTCQVFALAVDDGMTLGGAAKRMYDRLALEFLPGKMAFAPVAERREFGEGVENRRSNGAGMIFYGDPAMRVRGDRGEGEGLISSAVEVGEDGRLRVTITTRPMVSGVAGPDAMVPMWRLANYYSVRTAEVMKELAPELYVVVEVPRGVEVEGDEDGEVGMRVVSARVGEKVKLPTGEVRGVVEDWHGGVRRLHVRIPVAVRMMGSVVVEKMMREGVEVVVEME